MRSVCKKKILIFLILSVPFCFFNEFPYSNNRKSELTNEKQIILRLAETHSSNYPSTQGVNEFAKLVEERSKGRIKIIVYDSGKLGNENSVIEQVQFGGIDFARIDLASLEGYSGEIKLFMLPYIIKDSTDMLKVMDSKIGSEIIENLLKERYVCLCLYEAGGRCFYNSKHVVKTIDDLKGLKIRIQKSQQIMDTMSIMGVAPIFMEPSEIYSSLQEGLIDGAEDNIVMYYQSKNYQVAKFLTIDNHFRIPETIIASRVTMTQLSRDDQNLIEQAAKDSVKLQKKAWDEEEEEAVNFMVKSRINIVTMDEDSKNLFIKANENYYKNLNKDNLDYIINNNK